MIAATWQQVAAGVLAIGAPVAIVVVFQLWRHMVRRRALSRLDDAVRGCKAEIGRELAPALAGIAAELQAWMRENGDL